MRFLLDTNIISAYLKGDGKVFNRFMQYSGGLATSSVCVAELYAWVFRAKANPDRLSALVDLLSEVEVLPVDQVVALRFGRVRAALLDAGQAVPPMDLLIACAALTHDLTLVTHNVQDFARVEGLRIEDWLA